MKTELKASQSETPLAVPRSSGRNALRHSEETKPGRSALHIKEILVPTDFSEPSKVALRYAISFAKQLGARIALLHVIEPPVEYPEAVYPSSTAPDQITLAVEQTVARICEREKLRRQLMRQTIVQRGVPYEKITETAKVLKSDLIILATHGRTGLSHVFLGSTAEKVVRHAPCPVLVVRAQEHDLVTK